MCVSSQLLNSHSPLQRKGFFVGIFCLTGIIQKEKDKCDLPWLNLQQGQICRAQEKSQPEFNL